MGATAPLQMLVTDAWMLVAAIILRIEERPVPRGTGLPGSGVRPVRAPSPRPAP